jgi:hypothetical protein
MRAAGAYKIEERDVLSNLERKEANDCVVRILGGREIQINVGAERTLAVEPVQLLEKRWII